MLGSERAPLPWPKGRTRRGLTAGEAGNDLSAANVFPGNDVVTDVYEAGASATPMVEGASVYVFEAISQGAVVVKNGLAEVV